jgi:hypothetical protein
MVTKLLTQRFSKKTAQFQVLLLFPRKLNETLLREFANCTG